MQVRDHLDQVKANPRAQDAVGVGRPIVAVERAIQVRDGNADPLACAAVRHVGLR